MKLIYTIALGFFLITCQPTVNKEESEVAYNKGLRAADDQTIASYQKALIHFNEATELNPNNINAQFRKVDAAMRLGDFELVINTVNNIVDIPNLKGHELETNLLVMAGLSAIVLEKDGSEFLDKALHIYQEKIESDGFNMMDISNKALILCYMDRKSEAIEFLNDLTLNEENQAQLNDIKISIKTLDAISVINNLMLKS